MPEGISPPNHECRLYVLDVNVPAQYVDDTIEKEEVILVVGATGSGKSTQINAMLNNLLGTKWHETC
eukprot:5174168-Amphidinium_carterae.1